MADVIILDSSDEEDRGPGGKRKHAQRHEGRKRIKPTLLTKEVTIKPVKSDGARETLMEIEAFGTEVIFNSTDVVPKLPEIEIIKVQGGVDRPGSSSENRSTTDSPAAVVANVADKSKVNVDFENLLRTCKEADASPDMEKLINAKLLKYYRSAHPDFVNSKSFCKTVRQTAQRIATNTSLVYYELQAIVDELNIRRKSGNAIVTDADAVPSTGDAKLDRKLKKLNQALVQCVKKIQELEGAEVNFDEEVNSAHMMTERFKERACKIYDKICDLTGESRNANRTVHKAIKFNETSYIEFNKAVQIFCNKTLKFPDFLDILKILQHCNTQYDYGLRAEDQKRIAQTAFHSIGRLLQQRRKIDLYETVEHFTNHQRDPALDDAELRAKLEKNKKDFTRRIDDIINKYAQDPKSSDDDDVADDVAAGEPNQSEPKPKISPAEAQGVTPLAVISNVVSVSTDAFNNNAKHSQLVKIEPELNLDGDLLEP